MKLTRLTSNGRGRVGRLSQALTVALTAFLAGGLSYAEPGPISQLPLFLAKPVQPNIFFVLDDSGSMDWEVLIRSGAGNQGGSGDLDFTPNDNTEELEHCLGYNVLAYDPSYTYEPWSGVDVNGDAFADEDPNNARVNPYTGENNSGACDDWGDVYNTNGTTCDLINGFPDGNGGFYQPWNDADNDGEYDTGECSTNSSDRVYISTLPTAQQVNYANWFSYYRKREYVMKRAVSQIISDSTERMGLATINRNNNISKGNEIGTQIENIDDLSLPLDADAVADKVRLLDNLLGINSSGSTPLRLGLQNTGRYFMNQMNSSALFGFTPSTQADSASGHSPILSEDLGGACQQNFAVVMSDGFWNGGDPSVGNTDIDGAGDFDGQSYADAVGNTLADVAMHYYETDLLGLDDDVPVVRINNIAPGDVAECDAVDLANADQHPNCFDTNTQQHLVTYTVAFGITGTIPATDGVGNDCVPNSRGTSLASQNWPTSCDGSMASGWPTPVRNTNTTVDDMMHAAWNGRGQFLSATDPAGLINSLQQALDDISSKNPVSAAAVSVDSANISSGGNVVLGKFDSAYWSGELYSHPIVNGQIGATPAWSAHELLAARDYTSRMVVTYNGSTGVSFDFPGDYRSLGGSDISQDQVDDLLAAAPYPITTTTSSEIDANQAYGESLVDYLLGDASNEGRDVGEFRQRGDQRLGDIIHSGPVYVGDPDTGFTSNPGYQTWANTAAPSGAKGRREMIYVGANDGALHAFDADTGEEVFAYYPHAVFSDEERWGVHWLANRAYEHRYYVDGDIVVSEVYADLDQDGTEEWGTILVGSLGAGGRSIFAMDISDPSEFTSEAGVANNILWEFTHDDLGYTFTYPTITEMANGEWMAVFGNGYNPGSSSTGEAILFAKYLDQPGFEMVSTGVGTNTPGDCLAPDSNCNGLSTPVVLDLGGDLVADRVYAGDIQGNMWAFDVTDANPSNWHVDYSGVPFFQARSSDNMPQPITQQPRAVLHPTERHSSTSPNVMIFFGTGQYLAENDPITTTGNTFYGIWDDGSEINAIRNTVLVEQTVSQTTLAGSDVRLLTNNPVDYTQDRGWYFDFPETGERLISDPIIIGDLVVYSTLTPESNLCSTAGGTGWLMVHDLIDGSEPEYTALDINNDGNFDSSDQVGSANVGGVRTGEVGWGMTPTYFGDQMRIFLPGGSETRDIAPGEREGSRSSWGRYR